MEPKTPTIWRTTFFKLMAPVPKGHDFSPIKKGSQSPQSWIQHSRNEDYTHQVRSSLTQLFEFHLKNSELSLFKSSIQTPPLEHIWATRQNLPLACIYFHLKIPCSWDTWESSGISTHCHVWIVEYHCSIKVQVTFESEFKQLKQTFMSHCHNHWPYACQSFHKSNINVYFNWRHG